MADPIEPPEDEADRREALAFALLSQLRTFLILVRVLDELEGIESPWTRLYVLTAVDSDLGGQSPLEAAATGRVDDAIASVARYGKQSEIAAREEAARREEREACAAVIEQLRADLDAACARIEELEEALRPFARLAETWTVGISAQRGEALTLSPGAAL